MEVIVAVTRTAPQGQPRKGATDETFLTAVLEAVPVEMDIPLGQRTADRAQALAVRTVAAAGRPGIRVRLALAEGIPGANLTAGLGAPQAVSTQLGSLGTLPGTAALSPSSRGTVDVLRRRTARRQGTAARRRRALNDEVGLRDAGPVPTSHVLVVLRARQGREASRPRLPAAVAATIGEAHAGRAPVALRRRPPCPAVAATRAAVTGKAIGSKRMAAARLGLGQRMARLGIPRAARTGVLMRPVTPVVGRLKLIVGGSLPPLVPQEALEGRQRQVPSLVGRPALLGVRSGQPEPGAAKQSTGTAVPPGTASGQRDASIHGLTLGTPRLVTRLTKRPKEASAVTKTQVALGYGVPATARTMATPADGLATASPSSAVTGPVALRTTATGKAVASTRPRGRGATPAAPRVEAPADVPTQGRGLPQPPQTRVG